MAVEYSRFLLAQDLAQDVSLLLSNPIAKSTI
jgi:hypothetical protein